MLTEVVILNFNTRNLLAQLLPTVIANSKHPDVRIVVADNASSDGSADFVAENFPDVELIRMNENRGYAGGYNECLKNRTADYFVLLNSDAEPAAGWLEPLWKLAEKPGFGAAQPMILDYYKRDKFEYAGAAGGYMDHFGFPFCRGRIFGNVELNNGQYNDTRQVFWATGAALFISREAWETAGGLDEAFFAHMEEIDLCWRLQNAGYSIWASHESAVYHMGGGTLSNQSPRKTYLNFRNSLLMLHKNLPADRKERVLFARKLFDGLAGAFFLMQGKPGHIFQIIKAHRDFAELRKTVKAVSKPLPMDTLCGVLHGSLVFNYFIKGRKTWAKLKF